MAKVDWNTSDYQASEPRNFEPLPKGRYLCQLDDTEMKPTKDKRGSYLECTFTVVAPKEHRGRKVWARINVNNPSEIAQRIGREQFNALCLATVGTTEVRKTESLHNKKCILHISIDRSTEDPTNRVNGFEKYDGSEATGSQESKPAAPPETKPAPAPAAKKPAEDFDDDIPF